MTAVIQNNPKVQFFKDNGHVAANYKLYTYVTGTTTLSTTWQDLNQSTANTNPITLDARGECLIWLDPAVVYRLVLKTNAGATVWTVDNITGATPATFMTDLIGPGGSDLVGYIENGTGAIAETVQDKLRASPKTPESFGAVGDGSSDDTAALQAWANAGAGQEIRLPKPATAYKVTAAITLSDNTRIVGDKGAKIVTADSTISILSATSKTGVEVEGITFQYTSVGSTGLVAAVKFDTCTNCKVIGNTFTDCSWAGVYLTDSISCEVRGNYFSGTAGTHQDANDICVYNDSLRNIVEGNFCYTANGHGILHQGPTGKTPQHNSITNNDIVGKAAYGVVVYQVNAADTFTQVIGNRIRSIAGSATGGQTGSGIYIQSSGGTIVQSNEVQNTCTATSSSINLPAGISIAFGPPSGASMSPIVVEGNRVTTAHYHAIAVVGVKAIVTGNFCQTTDATNGYSMWVQDATGSIISNNRITRPGTDTRSCLVVQASLDSVDAMTVTNNVISGGDGVTTNVIAGVGYTIQANITGNTINGGGSSSQGLAITRLTRSTVTSNYIFGAAVGLYITSCTDVRGASNVVRVTSANRFLSDGSCNNVFFDQTNDFEATDTGKIQNLVVGCNIEQRAGSSPGGGNWQVGDRIQQSSPAVGQPKGWMCTVAGAPGTWVSEGNL